MKDNNRTTLHEAIIKVLKKYNRKMTYEEIAEEINKNDLYKRKKDDKPVTAKQIFMRCFLSRYYNNKYFPKATKEDVEL